MRVFESPADMRAWTTLERKAGRSVVLVPTMGALHEGHASLMDIARETGDVLVVSIFVNPTQFGKGEDLDRYPRPREHDLELCKAHGAAAVFYPNSQDMYAPDHTVYVVDESLSRGLCGPFRPGHFRGVLTVVMQLFHIVDPDAAVFGQKDAQQARLMQRMVRDLHMDIRILVAPIVREVDGVAMSSRNAYLSVAERARAVSLSRALQRGQDLYGAGERRAEVVCGEMLAVLASGDTKIMIDYVAAVDFGSLSPVSTLTCGTLLAVCARVGQTRLLDNVILDREQVAERFGLAGN